MTSVTNSSLDNLVSMVISVSEDRFLSRDDACGKKVKSPIDNTKSSSESSRSSVIFLFRSGTKWFG